MTLNETILNLTAEAIVDQMHATPSTTDIPRGTPIDLKEVLGEQGMPGGQQGYAHAMPGQQFQQIPHRGQPKDTLLYAFLVKLDDFEALLVSAFKDDDIAKMFGYGWNYGFRFNEYIVCVLLAVLATVYMMFWKKLTFWARFKAWVKKEIFKETGDIVLPPEMECFRDQVFPPKPVIPDEKKAKVIEKPLRQKIRAVCNFSSFLIVVFFLLVMLVAYICARIPLTMLFSGDALHILKKKSINGTRVDSKHNVIVGGYILCLCSLLSLVFAVHYLTTARPWKAAKKRIPGTAKAYPTGKGPTGNRFGYARKKK